MATHVPIFKTSGRSPGASGSRRARTAAFLASERDSRGGRATGRAAGGFAATAGSLPRLLLRLPTDRLPAQHLGGGAWVLRVADRAHHGDAFCAHLADARCIDPPDREPRLARVLLGVADQLEADRLDARLRGRRVNRADAQVVDV